MSLETQADLTALGFVSGTLIFLRAWAGWLRAQHRRGGVG